MNTRIWSALLFIMGVSVLANAQGPRQQGPPPKPDTPEIQAAVEKVRQHAGPMWANAVRFWCEAPRADSPTDPEIQPTKIFDNVWAMGNVGTTVYVIQTSDGLVMIDALNPNRLDTQLLPAFAKAGLDPAKVKLILVAHGHQDHFGGAPYFQEHFGSKVFMSTADWNLLANPAPGRGGPPATPPKRDGDLKEGQAVTLGDFKITPIDIPGHTPGSMGFIFPVTDKGQPHVAGLFGAVWLLPRFLSEEGMQLFVKSVDHWRDATQKAKVDVELMNHPLMDPLQEKLDKLAARRNNDPNPFVVGEAGYQTFLDTLRGCSEVDLMRRKL